MASQIKVVSKPPVEKSYSVARIPMVGEYIQIEDHHPNHWHKVAIVVHTPDGKYDAEIYCTEKVDSIDIINRGFPHLNSP